MNVMSSEGETFRAGTIGHVPGFQSLVSPPPPAALQLDFARNDELP
jgi:hypothetical protein